MLRMGVRLWSLSVVGVLFVRSCRHQVSRYGRTAVYCHPSIINAGMLYFMKKRKGVMQKVSLISGVASFILAIVCGALLYIYMDELGGNNPISASLMASTFFFVCVGSILMFLGRCNNLPSFKIDLPSERE